MALYICMATLNTMTIDNFTEKFIDEFNYNDTLYINRMCGGFVYRFLVRFVSFEDGIVKGNILDIQPNNAQCVWIDKQIVSVGNEISGKIKNCYTFKFGKGAMFFIRYKGNYSCVNYYLRQSE